jgi:uncharacterized membrane protein
MTKGTKKGKKYLGFFKDTNTAVVYEGTESKYYFNDDNHQYSVKLKIILFDKVTSWEVGQIHKMSCKYFYEIGDHFAIKDIFKRGKQ